MTERLPVIVHEHQFEAHVLTDDGLVLVGFWADWSGACHLMAPVLEAIAQELKADIKVVLVDIDRVSGLKTRYRVESVPTLLFFRGGRLVEQIVGTIPKKTLAENAASLVAKAKEDT